MKFGVMLEHLRNGDAMRFDTWPAGKYIVVNDVEKECPTIMERVEGMDIQHQYTPRLDEIWGTYWSVYKAAEEIT